MTAAGVIPQNTCVSFGKAFAVSRSSGNSAQAQMKDLVGPANFSLANCGTVIIRKQTVPDEDPNTTDFTYTTNVTTSPATTTSPFTLKDDGVNTILNVLPGSGKTVTESDPSSLNYTLTAIDCSASSVPANVSTNVGTRTATFSIAGGQTVDCTFTNTLQQGALKILKQSTKTGNPLVSNAGAVFSYDGSSVTDNGTGDEDSTIGEVCVSGLAPGSYTVNETTPPSGYGGASQTNQSVTVVANTDCGANPPAAAATATFTNPPLFDIQVNFRDGGSGETTLTSIDCAGLGTSPDTLDGTAATGWDDSATHEDVAVDPGPTETIVCTIIVDP